MFVPSIHFPYPDGLAPPLPPLSASLFIIQGWIINTILTLTQRITKDNGFVKLTTLQMLWTDMRSESTCCKYPNNPGLYLFYFTAIAMPAIPQAAAHTESSITAFMPHYPMLISSSSLAECFRFTNVPEAQLNASTPDEHKLLLSKRVYY